MGHARFFLMSAELIGGTACFLAGGLWITVPFVFLSLFVVGLDALLGNDASTLETPHPFLLNLLLFSTLPLVLAMCVVLWWMVGTGDPLGAASWIQRQTGYDPFAARAAIYSWYWLPAMLGGGLLLSASATNVGHELSHRTRSPFSMGWARWLLAFSGDASFSIEHVHGHHARLCTLEDPASARRGERVFGFILRSTIGQWLSAWELESARLRRKGHSAWGWRNRFFRGVLMTLLLMTLAYGVGGARALLLFVLVSIIAKAFLEAINFVEHYGLARVPGTKVEPRHSWNSNAAMSGWTLYNLVRHSDHHAEGSKPFWRLRPLPGAPMLPFGYMTMLVIAFVPPLFRKLMIPRLKAWDDQHATPAERQLALEASRGWMEPA